MRGSKEDSKILTLIWNKCKYFRNHWINPSQVTLGKWLCNQGGLDVCRRTLNRYLRKMQKRSQLNRIRRIRHDPKKGMVFQTTLYSIPYLGLYLLYQTGVITWDELIEYKKNSRAFQKRAAKKEKKGVTPADPGYFEDFTSYGGLMTAPG